jgi:LysM repeat protein
MVRRCPSCSSRLPAGARQCPICGEFLSWRQSTFGVLAESLAVVLFVAAVAGGLVWLRARGETQSPIERVVQQVVTALPTDMPTLTPAPSASHTPEPDTPPPPTGTPLPEYVTHEVIGGDTLFGIANQYDVAVDDILAANPDGLSADSTLSIGQPIRIPVAAAAAAAPAEEPTAEALAAAEPDPAGEGAEAAGEVPEGEPATPETAAPPTPSPLPTGAPVVVRPADTYVVEGGDTLGAIASTVGVPVEDLVRLNADKLAGPNDLLAVGDVLVVREATVVTATPDALALPTALPSVVAGPGRAAELAAVEQADGGPTLYPAPIPLGPGDGSTVTSGAPLLRWSSVGLLPEGVFYVVELVDLDGAPDRPQLEWITSLATAVRVPAELRPALGASRRIEWSVSVRRRAGRLLGADEGVVLGPASPTRTFTWQP